MLALSQPFQKVSGSEAADWAVEQLRKAGIQVV